MSTSVLLVDDDPDLCRLVAARLSERGFDVTWCSSGDDALVALARGMIDAVDDVARGHHRRADAEDGARVVRRWRRGA